MKIPVFLVHFFSKKETNQRKLPGNLLFPAHLSLNGAKPCDSSLRGSHPSGGYSPSKQFRSVCRLFPFHNKYSGASWDGFEGQLYRAMGLPLLASIAQWEHRCLTNLYRAAGAPLLAPR